MHRLWALGLLMVCLTAGCGSDKRPAPKDSVTVSGVVTLDGKPLEKATVRFVPTSELDQGYGGSGVTDSAGKYELSSLVEEKVVVGTPPGKYRVVVTKLVKPDGTVADPMEPPMMSAARESIPLKYSDYGQSKLDATVATTGGTFNFDLKSK